MPNLIFYIFKYLVTYIMKYLNFFTLKFNFLAWPQTVNEVGAAAVFESPCSITSGLLAHGESNSSIS